MTDLTSLAGFSVLIDDEKGRITFGDGIYPEGYSVCLSEIVPVLLNKYLKYPEIVYNYHPNIRTARCDDCEFGYHMFYMPYGLLGVEFMKTHVFYSDFVENKYDSFVEVHTGNISVIIQKNAEKEDEWDVNTYVEDLMVIHLSKGQKLAIPSGVYYAFANTGLRPAVFSMIRSNQPRQVDYESLKREKGLACFIISKNSKVAAVANPKYKMRKKLQSANLEKFMKDNSFSDVYTKPFDQQSEPLVNFMERLDFLKNYIYFA